MESGRCLQQGATLRQTTYYDCVSCISPPHHHEQHKAKRSNTLFGASFYPRPHRPRAPALTSSRVEEEIGRERLVPIAGQVGLERHATAEAELLRCINTAWHVACALQYACECGHLLLGLRRRHLGLVEQVKTPPALALWIVYFPHTAIFASVAGL